MPTVSLTAEQKLEAVKAVEQYGSVTAAAAALGMKRETLSHRYHMGVKAGLDEAIVHPAPTGHTVKGVSTLYNAKGEVSSQWVKTKANQISIEDMVTAIKDAFDDWDLPASGLIDVRWHEETPGDERLATIYPLADWHVGLLAWAKETGEDWDLSIGKAKIEDAMSRLVLSAPWSEQGVILGIGDLLHSDGYDNMTAKSKNLLDVDGRWPKVLRTAAELVIYSVDLARQKHKNVLVRILPGNHDEESAIAVSLALSMYYARDPQVTVDASPSRFWWWEWGTTLLGATHGDKAKMHDLPLIMAARNPEAWGRTQHRHIFTGHIHTQTGVEHSGVTVESFRTPVAPDNYHNGMGYGAGRTLTAITYDRVEGEISRTRVNVKTGAP